MSPKHDPWFRLFVSLGHAHLTDFNIATIIKNEERATALAGTKPYMGTVRSDLWPLINNQYQPEHNQSSTADGPARSERPGSHPDHFDLDWPTNKQDFKLQTRRALRTQNL